MRFSVYCPLSAVACLLLFAPLDASPPITAAAFAPDGETVVVGSQLGVQVHAWPSLESRQSLTTRLAHVHDLAFSPAGDRLAAAGGRPGEGGEIEIFDWPSGESLLHKQLADDLLYAIAWSDDGASLAAAGANAALCIVAADGDGVRSLAGHSGAVYAAAFLPKNDGLVSAAGDHTLRTWKPSTGEPLRTLAQHTGGVRSLAVRPLDEGPPQAASSGRDRTIRFWQPTIGRQLRFARLPSEALAIDWSPAGDVLLAACADGRLRIVDPQTVEITGDIQAIDGWAYVVLAHADGKHALVAGEGGAMKVIGYRELLSKGSEAP